MNTMRKLYIEDSFDPWITWDSDLFKMQYESKGKPEDITTFYGIDLTPSPWKADVFFINRETVNIRDDLFTREGKDVFMFVPMIEPNAQHELAVVQDVKYANEHGWTVVTESLTTYDKLKNVNLKNEPWLWRRPSRVSSERYMAQTPVDQRKPRVVTVMDAENPHSRVADLVKAYIGAFTILQDEHDIEPTLHIISPTELPFEPFNDIIFEGLMRNKKMLDFVGESSLFVWPCETEKYPNPLMEASQMGIPCFYRDPMVNDVQSHDIFPEDKHGQYQSVEGLTNMIVSHFIAPDANDDIINKQNGYVWEETTDFGLHTFLTEMSMRLNVGPLQTEDSE